jgi:choline kinase
LVEVEGKSILERQLEMLAGDDFDLRPRLVIGAKGECWHQDAYDTICRHVEDVVINFDNDASHNVYSMHLSMRDWIAAGDVPDLLLVDGDLVFTSSLLEKVLRKEGESFLVTRLARDRSDLGTRVVVDEDLGITALGKRIVPKHFPWDMHSGMLRIVSADVPRFYQALTHPENLFKELESAVRTFIEEGDMSVLRMGAHAWINVNTDDDLVQAKRLIGQGR